MKNTPYIGSGPYCYANFLAMLLGPDAPSPAAIEFATGSPFGMEIIGGKHPFFDPYGWDPVKGIDMAVKAAGSECTLEIGHDANDALGKLRQALKNNEAVFVGPLDMGQLRYHPASKDLAGADHFLVVLGVTETTWW